MTRRKFLYLLGLAVIAAIAAIPFLGSFDTVVRRIILRDLGSLPIPQSVLDKFLSDAKTQGIWKQFSFSKQMLIRVHYWTSPFIKLPYYHKYLHYKNIIAEEYLLSTSYFLSPQNVTYSGLFNPYKRPCFNPFSVTFSA